MQRRLNTILAVAFAALLSVPAVASAAGGPAQMVAPAHRITTGYGRALARQALKAQVAGGRWNTKINHNAIRHNPLGAGILVLNANNRKAGQRIVEVNMFKKVAPAKRGMARVTIKAMPIPLHGLGKAPAPISQARQARPPVSQARPPVSNVGQVPASKMPVSIR